MQFQTSSGETDFETSFETAKMIFSRVSVMDNGNNIESIVYDIEVRKSMMLLYFHFLFCLT